MYRMVFVIGPKVRGFKPGQKRWIFKGDKIRRATSFGGEVKTSFPCRLRHVKDTNRYEGDILSVKLTDISRQVSPYLLLGVSNGISGDLW
jgi:hypothetical protein